jgi:hypothetical protein
MALKYDKNLSQLGQYLELQEVVDLGTDFEYFIINI